MIGINRHGIDLRWVYSNLLLSLGCRTQDAYDVLHDAFVRHMQCDAKVKYDF